MCKHTFQYRILQFFSSRLVVGERSGNKLVLFEVHGINSVGLGAYINTDVQSGQRVDLNQDITVLSDQICGAQAKGLSQGIMK